jgi:transcription-repair coupling factor (superfamily II helicase)
VTLQLGVPLALPASWIPEESLRMALYKKVAGAADEDMLAREAAAAEDRYGAAPPEFRALLELARLRLLARSLGVKALQRRGDELAATLEKDHSLDPAKVLDLLRAGTLAAAGPDAFRLPKAFAGAPPDGLATRARDVLVSLAREAS